MFYSTPLRILLLAGVLLLLSCEKKEQTKSLPIEENTRPDTISPSPWVNYEIPPGEHYNSLRSFELFPYDSLTFEFAFDSTAIYYTREPHNQADWNKLMGFSDCQSHHQTNSVRLVWRWSGAQGLEIGQYFYLNGNRQYSTLTTVAIGDTNRAFIYISNGLYHLKVNEAEAVVTRHCDTRASSYWLYPYFGGDEAAPHKINVFVRHLFPVVNM